MIFTQKHLRKIVVPHTVDVTFIGCHQTLQAVGTHTQTVDGPENLEFRNLACIFAVNSKNGYLAVSTSDDDFFSRNGFNCFDSHRTDV